MLRRWRLPAFQNVVADGTAVLPNIPQGETFNRIVLALGGTALTKAMITGLRIRAGGKQIWDVTGSHLDKINSYMGETANAAFLSVNFAERESKDLNGEGIGALDTSILPPNQFAMEVDIAGATAPTLTGYAYTSPPQAGNGKPVFKALLKSTHTPGAAGEFALPIPTGSVSGNLIKRVHMFHSNITEVDVKLDGTDLMDNGLLALMQFEQNELTRTTQTGMLVFDPLVGDDQREAISTVRADGSPANLDYRVTVSGGDTIVAYTELYTQLSRV